MPFTPSFDELLTACQRSLRHSIHANTLRISVADFLALTAPYNQSLTPVPWCAEGFWIERDDEESVPLGSIAEYLSGLLYVQEVSSVLSVAALFAEGNISERVMDVAAAPGSKTTQTVTKMNNQGAILVNEFSVSRVEVLYVNVSRRRIANVAPTHFGGHVFGAALPESFDAILLNASCSDEDTVCKDSDAPKNWSVESDLKIAATQRELLNSASHALHPGSTLIYSTCTLNHDENENIMQWLIETYPDTVEFLPLGDLFPQAGRALTPEEFLHVFPQIHDCKGFSVTCLRKTATIPALSASKYKVGNFPSSSLKRRESTPVTQTASACGL